MIEFYSTETFKEEYDKLIRKNSYKELSKFIISELIDGNIELGTVLNINNPGTPFIKRRINGRGGYRLYLVLLKLKNKVILGFVHPKKGTFGYENITTEKIKLILKDIIESTKENNLYKINKCPENKKLIFNKEEKYIEVV